MIKDMIAKLVKEAEEEAEAKAWCDKELKENKLTRTAKTEERNQLQSKAREQIRGRRQKGGRKGEEEEGRRERKEEEKGEEGKEKEERRRGGRRKKGKERKEGGEEK